MRDFDQRRHVEGPPDALARAHVHERTKFCGRSLELIIPGALHLVPGFLVLDLA